jgi:hypothetical protein
MSSKKKRQTMDKLRREQTVRKRREDKLQRKAEARALKTATAAGAVGEAARIPETPPAATVDATKNGSGLRDAPSLRVHQQ